MKCDDIIHKAFLNNKDARIIQEKLSQLFDKHVNHLPLSQTRPGTAHFMKSKGDIQSTRDALWFGVPDNDEGDTFWMPLYRVTKRNGSKTSAIDPHKVHELQSEVHDIRKLDDDVLFLKQILDKINTAFGLNGPFQLNHCVVHQYMGIEDESRRVHRTKGDHFPYHHDKIVDLNLHHKTGIVEHVRQSKPMIFSLSIGAERNFLFNLHDKTDQKLLDVLGHDSSKQRRVQEKYPMNSGDLICMDEDLNLRVKHGVDQGHGIRYSITARTVHTYYKTNRSNDVLAICPYYTFEKQNRCFVSAYSHNDKEAHRYLLSKYLENARTEVPKILLIDDYGAGTTSILEYTTKAHVYPVCLGKPSIDHMNSIFSGNVRVPSGAIHDDIDIFLENNESSMWDVIWLDYDIRDKEFKHYANAVNSIQVGGILAVTLNTRGKSADDLLHDTEDLLTSHFNMRMHTRQIYPSKGGGPPMIFVVAQKHDKVSLPPLKYWDVLGKPMLRKVFDDIDEPNPGNKIVTYHYKGVEYYLAKCGRYSNFKVQGNRHFCVSYRTIYGKWQTEVYSYKEKTTVNREEWCTFDEIMSYIDKYNDVKCSWKEAIEDHAERLVSSNAESASSELSSKDERDEKEVPIVEEIQFEPKHSNKPKSSSKTHKSLSKKLLKESGILPTNKKSWVPGGRGRPPKWYSETPWRPGGPGRPPKWYVERSKE